MKKIYILILMLAGILIPANAGINPDEPDFISDYPHLKELSRDNPALLADIKRMNDYLDNLTGTAAFRRSSRLHKQQFEKAMSMRAKVAEWDTTIHVETAGTLSTRLTAQQKGAITGLTLTGNIDARDFRILRDSMPVLLTLDISDVTIEAYTGTQGTAWGTQSVSYPADAIPQKALSPNTHRARFETIILPSSINAIGDSAFFHVSGWKGQLAIPPSVTTIGDAAFVNCYNLTGTLVLHDAITRIGEGSFSGCQGFTELSISASLDSISDYAFAGCWGVGGNIILPASVKYIGRYSFYYSGMTSITLPDSLEYIGEGAFATCKQMDSHITIPEKVTVINNGTFSRCILSKGMTLLGQVVSIEDGAFTMSGLTSINIPNSVVSIGDAAFAFCRLSGELTIPGSVTSIGVDAFRSNLLTSITIPASVDSIGHSAFYLNCNVISIYAFSSNPVDLSNSPNVFYCMDTKTTILYVPEGASASYRTANQWGDFENIVEMNSTGIPGQTTDLNRRTGNDALKFFPNPVVNGFYLETGEGLIHISVHALNGAKLISRHVQGNEYVDIETLQAGVYVLKVNIKGTVYEKKLIKK